MTNCHTITSRLVSGRGNGGSWKFPFADQSKGHTISGLLAKPPEGQTGSQGVGNFCSASKASVSGFNCLRGLWGGSQSLLGHLTVPGSLLQLHIPDLKTPINITLLCRAQKDKSMETGCWWELLRDSQHTNHNQHPIIKTQEQSHRPTQGSWFLTTFQFNYQWVKSGEKMGSLVSLTIPAPGLLFSQILQIKGGLLGSVFR